jgi:hypothetical protein
MLHPVTVELPVKTERLPHPFPGKKIYKIMPVKIEEELHVSFFYQHEAIFQRLFETDGVICLKVSPEDTNQSFRYFFEAAFNSLMDHPPRDPKTPFIVFEGTTAPDCQPDLFVHKVENEIGFHTLINAATATEQQYPYLSREAREGLSFAVKNKSFHVDPTLLTGDLTLLQLPCPEALTSLLHFQKIAKEHSITSNDNSFFKLTRVYCSTIAQEGMI